MARKRYKPEEIVAKLRQVDVLMSQGQSTVEAIRQIGVSEVTYYRWRQDTVVARQRTLQSADRRQRR
jgi:putative transposase